MQRLAYIDALRGLAIAYMIINHTAHYLFGSMINYNIYLAIYLTVAGAAPLFLFLVGFSLVLSDKQEGFVKYLKRGLGLIILNFLINGFFYFNEPLYRGRILFLIGLAIIVGYPFLLLIRRQIINRWLLAVLVFLGLMLSSLAHNLSLLIPEGVIREIFFSEFTFFPWFLVVLAGMIFADYWLKLAEEVKSEKKKKISILGLALISFWFIVSIMVGRIELFSFVYDNVINNYWLPSALTWFWIMGLIFLTFGLVYSFYQNTESIIREIFFSNLEAIGRYAIYLYFLQFFVIKTLLEKLTWPGFISDFPGFYFLIISLLIIICLCYLAKSKLFVKVITLGRQKVTVKTF